MSSISSLFSGQYYQLNNQASSSNSSTSNDATSTVDPLLNALGSTTTDNSTTATTGNSYLLDLSEQAKTYLANLQNSSSTSSSSSSASSGSDTFMLSPSQRQQLNSIVAKYQNEPVTQSSYDQLQDDLKAAGLAPDQLAVRDQMRDMNPTKMFIDALNGTDDSDQISQNGQMTDEQQTQSANYMQSILNQWQSISTVPSATTASSATATPSTDDTSASA